MVDLRGLQGLAGGGEGGPAKHDRRAGLQRHGRLVYLGPEEGGRDHRPVREHPGGHQERRPALQDHHRQERQGGGGRSPRIRRLCDCVHL